MTTIRLSERLVERLRRRGITNIENFIETVIERMDDAAIAETHEPADEDISADVEARISALRTALQDFRHGMSDLEWADIARAMNEEYIEPEDADGWKHDLPEEGEQ